MTQAAELYGKLWTHPEYRQVAPGEDHALRFVDICKPSSMVIDFGVGTGRGAALIKALTDQPVVGIDIANNCLDPDIDIPVTVADLTKPLHCKTEWGFCTDVLEHIAPEDVDAALENILDAAATMYFAISTVADHYGPALMGEPLHLTVQHHAWWRKKFEALECDIIYEEDLGSCSIFVVSGWTSATYIEDRSDVNTSAEVCKENIRRNLRLDLQQVRPCDYDPNAHLILLGGGPSVEEFEAEIYEQAKAGVPVVTVNNAYNWCLDHGILPAAQIMLDARPFNARFVRAVIPNCKYFVASQCDHDFVRSLPRAQTWLWHSGDSEGVKSCIDEYAVETGMEYSWFPVHGGTTVMLRAIPLLAMLGWRRFDIYGWDSCLMNGRHHAYEQPENDAGKVFEVHYGGRQFLCHAWMLIQANEFPRIVRAILSQIDGLALRVHGDGLIAWMLEHASNQVKGH